MELQRLLNQYHYSDSDDESEEESPFHELFRPARIAKIAREKAKIDAKRSHDEAKVDIAESEVLTRLGQLDGREIDTLYDVIIRKMYSYYYPPVGYSSEENKQTVREFVILEDYLKKNGKVYELPTNNPQEGEEFGTIVDIEPEQTEQEQRLFEEEFGTTQVSNVERERKYPLPPRNITVEQAEQKEEELRNYQRLREQYGVVSLGPGARAIGPSTIEFTRSGERAIIDLRRSGQQQLADDIGAIVAKTTGSVESVPIPDDQKQDTEAIREAENVFVSQEELETKRKSKKKSKKKSPLDDLSPEQRLEVAKLALKQHYRGDVVLPKDVVIELEGHLARAKSAKRRFKEKSVRAQPKLELSEQPEHIWESIMQMRKSLEHYYNGNPYGLPSSQAKQFEEYTSQFTGEGFTGGLEVRLGPSPAVRSALQKIGNVPIREVYVCRRPLPLALNFIAKLLASNAPYDEFFHLFLTMDLMDGTSWKFEKNHIVELQLADNSSYKNATCIPLGRPIRGMTLNQAIDKAQKEFGMERVWYYDPVNHNCQYFALDITKQMYGNVNPEVQKFVFQDVKGLYSKSTSKVARFVTDIAGWWDRVIHGAGH